MTLLLQREGTIPGISLKTYGLPDDNVYVSGIPIPTKAFLDVTIQLLVKPALLADDPRRDFVACMKAMEKTLGYGDCGERFESALDCVTGKRSGMPAITMIVLLPNGTPLNFGKVNMEDALIGAHYVLTNTNLTGDDDPRISFIATVASLEEIEIEDGIKHFAVPTPTC